MITSTCRSFATISSGLYRFLAITVLLDVKDIPQVGPLQWGRINVQLTDPMNKAGWNKASPGFPLRGFEFSPIGTTFAGGLIEKILR
jgi:hypothetical protein